MCAVRARVCTERAREIERRDGRTITVGNGRKSGEKT